jgi:hypothetical protein
MISDDVLVRDMSGMTYYHILRAYGWWLALQWQHAYLLWLIGLALLLAYRWQFTYQWRLAYQWWVIAGVVTCLSVALRLSMMNCFSVTVCLSVTAMVNNENALLSPRWSSGSFLVGSRLGFIRAAPPYVSCMHHVCVMYVSYMCHVCLYNACMCHVCMHHVWVMYESCMCHVCMYHLWVM